MSVAGTWTVTVKSPMGPLVTTLVIQEENGMLTGTQSRDGQSLEIKDGKIEGNMITWLFSLDKPIPASMVFTGIVDGDKMSGKADAGFMGKFNWFGQRAA